MTDALTASAATTSVLSFAASVRRLDCVSYREPLQDLVRHDPPVPMYKVSDKEIEQEASSALQALEEISDRLRRLHAAYGEWADFDTGAYFDLSPAQTRRFVRVSERVSSVHIAFFVDLLLPSFHLTEIYWHDHFCPAYWGMLESLRKSSEPARAVKTFTDEAQPEMLQRWARLSKVVNVTLERLQERSDYLMAYLCQEERARWQSEWRQKPVRGIDSHLQPDLRSLSTLTLSTEFPLPAGRQPGRLRRLRANRSRSRPPRFLQWRSLDS